MRIKISTHRQHEIQEMNLSKLSKDIIEKNNKQGVKSVNRRHGNIREENQNQNEL